MQCIATDRSFVTGRFARMHELVPPVVLTREYFDRRATSEENGFRDDDDYDDHDHDHDDDDDDEGVDVVVDGDDIDFRHRSGVLSQVRDAGEPARRRRRADWL